MALVSQERVHHVMIVLPPALLVELMVVNGRKARLRVAVVRTADVRQDIVVFPMRVRVAMTLVAAQAQLILNDAARIMFRLAPILAGAISGQLRNTVVR